MCPKPLHLSNKKSNKKSDVVVRTLMLRGCSKNCSNYSCSVLVVVWWQLTLRDLTNLEPTVHELNDSVESIISRSEKNLSLVNKQRDMNDMYSVVQVLARDQTHALHDKYRQASSHCLMLTCYSQAHSYPG